MAGVLLLLFLVVPIVELYVIIQVGSTLGAGPTIALLILVSVLGAWLVKREGLGVWTRFRTRVERGALPTDELLDGLLILFAGALMLTPGFLTDLLGVLLLVPVSRAVARGVLARRFRSRIERAAAFSTPGGFGYGAVYETREVQDVGDVTPPEWRRSAPDGRDELGS